MKRYTESAKKHNQGLPKRRGDYARSRARYVEQQHEATDRRRKLNPRLLILNVDFFELLEEQNEQS